MGCLSNCCTPPKEPKKPIRNDPNSNAPTHNRSCTDTVGLILFIIFLGGWGYLGYYSYKEGNVGLLLAPINSKGERCGFDSRVKDKKYLVFFDIRECLSPNTPITGCTTKQVCVKECPTETINFEEQLKNATEKYTLDKTLMSKMVCNESVDSSVLTNSIAKQYLRNKTCAKFVLKSTPVLFRCIGDLSTLTCDQSLTTSSSEGGGSVSCSREPKADEASLRNRASAPDSYVGWIIARCVTYFAITANKHDAHVIASQIVSDLVNSRWYMLGALFAVVVVCFVYIALLRWVVAPVVWTSLVGLLTLLAYSLWLCCEQYIYYVAVKPPQVTTNINGVVKSWLENPITWMVIMIVVAIVFLILLLVVCSLRSRINMAIALIKEGSRAVGAIKSTIFLPIFPWLLQCGVIAYATYVLIYLMSSGEQIFEVVNLTNDPSCSCYSSDKGNPIYSKDRETCDPGTFSEHCFKENKQPCDIASCSFASFENNALHWHLLNLLGFFWTMAFVGGVADMILATTFATWYWTFDKKKDLPSCTLTGGIFRVLCYHLGTVAFGSLTIAIVRVIRVFLEYINKKLKKFDNSFTRRLMCCCKCFFWCFDNYIKFINKNAYIMCAIHGTSFCASARDAFSLLMRNIVRVVVLDKVMGFIFFLSKLLLSIGVGFAVYYILKLYENSYDNPLHYNHIPAVILGVATYLISTIFFNVYSMAVDTLFLCFLEDYERNDGSVEKPYFIPTDLMKILGKRNKRA